MTEDRTLLAHIALKLGTHPENIAVEALGHILSTSEAAIRAVEDVLKTGGAEVDTISHVRTQASDEKGAIPDLACFDQRGVERVLIEAKFWAGLTKRQPVAYLKRLPTNKPSALLFVAPEARFEPLWAELRRRVIEAGMDLGPDTKDVNLRRSEVGDGRYLMLTSWKALLDGMASTAKDDGHSRTENDIRQLLGLTKQVDKEAFLPLRSEELGPELPRRLCNLRRLVDDATTRACEARRVSINALYVTSKPEGYGRYLKLAGASVWFGVNSILWARSRETPLWLTFHPGDGRITLDEVRRSLRPLGQKDPLELIDSDGRMHVPINMPVGVEYDRVLAAVVKRLEEVAQLIDSPDTTS